MSETSTVRATSVEPRTLPRFEAAARAAISRNEIPAVVAMAANADRVLYETAFGPHGVPGKAAVAVDDVFFIASMTKAITAFAATQLIEAGKLDLDMNADDLLPEIRDRRVLTGFDSSGKPIFRRAARPVTVRQLFTHTSGYATDVWNPLIKQYSADFEVPSMATCKKAAMDVPLVFDPGTRWEYSVSIDWLGWIVERLSGLDLETYFRRNIFEPLGMEWTSFIISPEQRARLVPVRAKGEDAQFSETGFEVSQTPEFHMGGAGLYGTAGDYIKFLQMLLNRGTTGRRRIARSETVDLFLANHIGDMELPVLPTAMPFLSADVDFLPGNPKKWSLGFMINTKDVAGGRRAGSQFWGGLASTYFWLDPASRLAGLVMFSYFPFADPAGVSVFDAFERDVYSAFGGS